MLLCLDVDGTLETSNGPVRVARLDELRDSWGYIYVAVVSPSGADPKHEDGSSKYPRFVDGPSRAGNLLRAKAAFPPQRFNLYISDNQDRDAATEAGFAFMEPKDFR